MEVESGPSLRLMTQLEPNKAFQGGERPEPLRNLVAFWLLGLFNNAAYVIMIAGANNISAAAVGLVYLCAVAPAILCKATGPYWFHLVTYRLRMATVAALMACSYTTVALSSHRGWQLLGVVFASLQGGLGEASCLALTSYYCGRQVITAWSSGTGFAGVFGYTWVAALHVLGGLSFQATLMLANATPLAFLAVYYALLRPPRRLPPGEHASLHASAHIAQEAASLGESQRLLNDGGRGSSGAYSSSAGAGAGAAAAAASGFDRDGQHPRDAGGPLSLAGDRHCALDDEPEADEAKASKAGRMTWRERAERTVALWPYMVPLTVVYFAEYAMQSGTWTAIGFPVTDPRARHNFYTASNWCYQAGVFVSRSSGLLYQASRGELWAMPAMQVGWLAFFLADAVYKFWYNWGLLVPCFITGLLGGAVYVNAFTLISKEVEPQHREFSLGAASLADSLGVALADVSGILIQGCLFKANSLAGADFKC